MRCGGEWGLRVGGMGGGNTHRGHSGEAAGIAMAGHGKLRRGVMEVCEAKGGDGRSAQARNWSLEKHLSRYPLNGWLQNGHSSHR